MSLTINVPMSHSWKRIKFLYVSLAAGLAIAVTAAIGVAASQSPEAAVSPLRASSPLAIARNAQLPQLTIYLVESQEQAGLMRKIENEAAYVRYELNIAEPPFAPMILVLDTPEATQRAQATIAGTYAEGADSGNFVVQKVDMRGR